MKTEMRRQLMLLMAIGFMMAVQAQTKAPLFENSAKDEIQAQTKAPLFENSAKDEIAANRYLAGSNYLDYDRQLSEKVLTPAPKGYEPFYMSHYGRHGSRWLIGEREYTLPMGTLRNGREAGKLTSVSIMASANVWLRISQRYSRLLA